MQQGKGGGGPQRFFLWLRERAQTRHLSPLNECMSSDPVYAA